MQTQLKRKENINQHSNLGEIFQKYPGKLIYVDFWASWCVPCRDEMPSSKALLHKLKDKDIVFLYLGFNDSATNWLIARKNLALEGEHYLLSPAQVLEATKAFGINGIPHHAIINQKGEIVNKNAIGPGERNAEDTLRAYY